MPLRPVRRPVGARVAVALGLLGLLVTACAPVKPAPAPVPPTTPPVTTPTGALPAGLPPRLGIGLAASTDDLAPSGWVASTGVPFDYAYQYLAGGVNTGAGWQTWTADAEFPLVYAQDAHARGAIPVLTYYMLLQSTGPCGSCGEPQQDLTNLNTNSLMASYYQDFATVMQRLGWATVGGIAGYGGTVIVQVEPDLSGYAEQAVLDPSASCYGYCTGTGNDPNLLRASVASSGDPDVAAYPNTWRGFNLALLHLRDLYAPKVELGFHVSDWATGLDIGSDPSPTLSGTTQGDLAGIVRGGQRRDVSAGGDLDLRPGLQRRRQRRRGLREVRARRAERLLGPAQRHRAHVHPLGAVPRRGDRDDRPPGDRLAGAARQPVVPVRGQHHRPLPGQQGPVLLRPPGRAARGSGSSRSSSVRPPPAAPRTRTPSTTASPTRSPSAPPTGSAAGRSATTIRPLSPTTTAATSGPRPPRTTPHRCRSADRPPSLGVPEVVSGASAS